MHKVFMAKIGIVPLLLNIIIQNLLSAPLLILLYIYCEKTVFKVIVLLFNSIVLTLKSLVIVKGETIICRNIVGARQKISIDRIYSLKILSSSEYKKLNYNMRTSNPLITNVFYFIMPVRNIIFFNNSDGRKVVLGLWNPQKLYHILEQHNTENAKTFKHDYGIQVFSLNVSLLYGFKIYFSNWLYTFLGPIIVTSFFYFLLYLEDIKNVIIPILVFLFLSVPQFFHFTKITINTTENAIRINSLPNGGVFIYDRITDVCKTVSDNVNSQDKTTINAVYNKSGKCISFIIQHNNKPTQVLVDTKDNEKLYDLLFIIQND